MGTRQISGVELNQDTNFSVLETTMGLFSFHALNLVSVPYLVR